MTLKVTFVELPMYERLYPLASGYMQSYACQDAEIKRAFTFEKYSVPARTSFSKVLGDLEKSNADIYAFSCYLWNMGLVRRLINFLLGINPNAYFMLGGPQVMHQGQKYLNPRHERVVLCNGEGEKTFYEFIRELTETNPNLSRVRGLSFYLDNELITTENQDRIRQLDDIPSPFLTGVFDSSYAISIFETNRGCPFSCGFCYWGGEVNAKVLKFSQDRLQDELRWLSEHGCQFLFIADANWGIFPRDVELSKYIIGLNKKNKVPTAVYYSAAKNRPDRVTEITELFAEAGIVATQGISLQTMSEESLALIDRKNIKLSAYTQLQSSLNEKGISSFTELIWPLPGETLSSLRTVVNNVCQSNSDTIVIYPHLLLNNTTLYHKRKELGLECKRIDDVVGEVDLVVQTSQASAADFEEGIRLFYALHLLHNMRGLYLVAGYLSKNLGIQASDLFSSFADFCRGRRDNPVSDFCERSLAEYDFCDVFNYGKAVHFSLHVYREAFDDLLYEFAQSQQWYVDPTARTLFEVDLINKPYVYSNTPLWKSKHGLEHLKILDVNSRSFIVKIPEDPLNHIRELIEVKANLGNQNTVFSIDHKKLQYPYMKSQSLDHHAGYCHGMISKAKQMLPTWTGLS